MKRAVRLAGSLAAALLAAPALPASAAVAVADPAVAPAVAGETADLIAQVKDVQHRMNALIHLKRLTGDLLEEAKQVKLVADQAFDGSVGGNPVRLRLALRSYKNLINHLEEKAEALRGEQVAAARAAKIEAKEQQEVVGKLTDALAVSKGDPKERDLAFHRALVAAKGLLGKRTSRLAAEEARLRSEIEDLEAKRTDELLRLLKQRRNLPMETQVAVLRRAEFADDAHAQALLRAGRKDEPLYEQLQAMLPHSATQPAAAATPKDHLAAAGSDGRVHIVSSRMKNAVQSMAENLQHARERLAKIVAAGGPAAEVAQARDIVAGLDHVLGEVGGTHDLRKQLNAMDEMEQKLKEWMKAAQG